MSDEPRSESGWKARLRRWLWLDRSAVRTDRSEANRGLYPGGPPVYTGRKPVGWRFAVVMIAIGTIIALIIIGVRSTEAQAAHDGQRIELEKPGFAVTVPADWDVRLHDPWQESHGDILSANGGPE